jgi:hypothetical protein
MNLIREALRAGHAGPAAKHAARPGVVVAGGGGALGSAVLERLLASRAFAPVRVLVTQSFSATVRGLEPLLLPALDAGIDTAPDAAVIPELAIVVFDRERHANGRDAAFARPQPEALPALARWLRSCGVRHLIVVMPHDAALLPEALKVGLANLDEHAVAALGFDHVVFVRSAQLPSAEAAGAGPQRLADLVLAQLRLMTPQNQQPVRPKKVAELIVWLARQLPSSRAGTRVLPPEQVWQAAQVTDPGALLHAWLGGADLPPASVTVPRM